MPGHDLPLLTRKKCLGREGYLISSVSPVASLTITDTTSLSNLAWNLRLTSDVSFHKYLQYMPNSLHGITLLLWIVQCLYVLNHTGCSNMWVTGLAWGPWELMGRWQWVPPPYSSSEAPGLKPGHWFWGARCCFSLWDCPVAWQSLLPLFSCVSVSFPPFYFHEKQQTLGLEFLLSLASVVFLFIKIYHPDTISVTLSSLFCSSIDRKRDL